MTNKEFYEFFEYMIDFEKVIMVGKGKEYTVGSKDKLANFKETGRELDIEPIKVLMIFLNKHLASIRNYVKDGIEASNEPIEGRIMDARNYLALLAAIIKENKAIIKNEYNKQHSAIKKLNPDPALPIKLPKEIDPGSTA